jgi:hypothetical protein
MRFCEDFFVIFLNGISITYVYRRCRAFSLPLQVKTKLSGNTLDNCFISFYLDNNA